MALTEARRSQLDSIVGQMVQNKEPDSAIQFVVNDFKAKYENEVQPQQKTNLLQSAAKPFLKTVSAIPAVAEGVANLAQGDVAGMREALTRERDYGAFGKVRPIGINQETGEKQSFGELAKDVVGTGAEIASYLAPVGIAGKGTVTAGGGALKAGQTVLKPSIKSLVKGGALSGALGSAGQAAGEGKDIGQIAKAGVAGGILGGAAGGVLPLAGRGAAKVVDKTGGGKVVTDTAKAFGKSLPERLINNIIRPSKNAFRFGKNPGRAVAELNIIGNSEEELLQNITQRRQELGSEIGQIISSLKEEPSVSVQDTLAPLNEAIAASSKFKRTNQPLIGRLESLRDDLIERIGGPEIEKITPQLSFELKQEIGNMSSWTGQSFDKELNQARVGAYSKLRKALEDAAEREYGLIGNNSRQLKKLNDLYGNLVEAEGALQNRIGVSQRNNMISLPDIGVAGAATVATGGFGGIAALLLKKGAETTAFKTRLAAKLSGIIAKLSPEEQKVLVDVAPRIADVVAELSSAEKNKFVDNLPLLIKLLRTSLVNSAANNSTNAPQDTNIPGM